MTGPSPYDPAAMKGAREVVTTEDTMKKYILEQLADLRRRTLNLERAVDVLETHERS